MKQRLQRICGSLLAIAALYVAVARGATAQDAAAVGAQPLDQPVPVGAVRGLLYARVFTLKKPYTYTFLKEQPAITRGWILVIEVDPEIAKPRQVDVPVLYVGDTPAHLTNTGYPTGRMVVIVPDWIDLSKAPIFFGSTELPERVDRARGARELTSGLGRTARPFAPEVLRAAFAAGGKPRRFAGSVELFRAIADLIDRYAGAPNTPAEIYRTPLVEE
jgi:hypothetical protein